jgi:hypothetical protein
MRIAAAVLAACLTVLPGMVRADADVVSLSLDEALFVAQQAVLAGDAGLGYAIARRLIEADPANARAQLIIAATAPSLGLAAEGRRAGRTAWQLTRDPGLRYEIARHTAKAAYSEGNPHAVLFWLRRAADAAPTAEDYDQTVGDIANVRSGQRLRYVFDVSVSPSDNLNNGDRGGPLMIDDWFTIGPQSADAQALSGVRSVVQAQLTYRLGGAGRTFVGARGYVTVNRLSDAAQDTVDGLLTGSDLNILQLEATITHTAHWPGSEWPIMVTGAIGNTWSGKQDLGPHLRLEMMTPLSRSQPIRLTLSAEAQSQSSNTMYGLAASINGGQRVTGGELTWRLGLRQNDGPDVNQSYHQVSSEIGYAFAKPLGSVTLSFRAGGTIRDYESYRLSFIYVTGGRQDRTAMLGIDAVFHDMQVLGYVPRVSLSATATDSNISRFETREIGVTFGIQSKF